MTTQRRTARRPGGSVPARRATTWHNQLALVTQTAVASLVTTDLTHNMIAAGQEPGGSCVRLILEVRVSSAATVPELESFAIGVAVVTADALVAGSAAMPNPLSDEDQDWYYWWGSDGIATTSTEILVARVDIRSARKLRGGYRLVILTENGLNELALNVSIMARTLWMFT